MNKTLLVAVAMLFTATSSSAIADKDSSVTLQDLAPKMDFNKQTPEFTKPIPKAFPKAKKEGFSFGVTVKPVPGSRVKAHVGPGVKYNKGDTSVRIHQTSPITIPPSNNQTPPTTWFDINTTF